MTTNLDIYHTIAAPADAVFRSKNSRFLAFAYPVSSVEEAQAHIARLRKEYHDARHVCYAYCIGIEGAKWRTFDDGEPSGTAGNPIRGQILSAGLTDVLIAVVRYFGGTLLGASGLIAAYKTAAKMALDKAEVSERFWTQTIEVSFDAAQTSRIMQLIKTEGIQIAAQAFDLQYRLWLKIRSSRAAEFRQKLSAIGIVQ
jgi:uncharacterized YigZ family protein